jgi:hypothetical protein
MARLSSATSSALLSIVWLAGCGDDAHRAPDSGVELPPSDGPTGVAELGAGLAVVNSDYTTTSVSLLSRATGEVTKGDCINSGTHVPGSTLTLSGDVVLPSQAQPGNPLLVIDRSNGVLTWLDPSTCAPLRQLDVSTGFFANPHDVIAVSPTKAYVTRYEKNPTPTADPADRDDGQDLLIIDPSAPSITGRIDLSSYAVAAAGAAILARPDRARLIGSKLVVSLGNIDGAFQASSHGRLIIVDTVTDQVSATVDLPYKGCGGLSYVETSKTLFVACGGFYKDEPQIDGSGIVSIDFAASPPVEIKRQPAAPFGRPLGGYTGLARDGALGLAVAPGFPKDELWTLDTATGAASKLDDASDGFTFGTVLVDPVRERAYLTDGDMAAPRVHIYSYAGGAAPSRQRSVDPNPVVGLPPREIAWY